MKLETRADRVREEAHSQESLVGHARRARRGDDAFALRKSTGSRHRQIFCCALRLSTEGVGEGV